MRFYTRKEVEESNKPYWSAFGPFNMTEIIDMDDYLPEDVCHKLDLIEPGDPPDVFEYVGRDENFQELYRGLYKLKHKVIVFDNEIQSEENGYVTEQKLIERYKSIWRPDIKPTAVVDDGSGVYTFLYDVRYSEEFKSQMLVNFFKPSLYRI